MSARLQQHSGAQGSFCHPGAPWGASCPSTGCSQPLHSTASVRQGVPGSPRTASPTHEASRETAEREKCLLSMCPFLLSQEHVGGRKPGPRVHGQGSPSLTSWMRLGPELVGS